MKIFRIFLNVKIFNLRKWYFRKVGHSAGPRPKQKILADIETNQNHGILNSVRNFILISKNVKCSIFYKQKVIFAL
jgi:hypothetical protein